MARSVDLRFIDVHASMMRDFAQQSISNDHRTRCRNCGYLLSGLQSTRCPECGLSIEYSTSECGAAPRTMTTALAILACTLVIPAILSIASAPGFTSPGSIWVMLPDLVLESKVVAVVVPSLCFFLCSAPLIVWPQAGRVLAICYTLMAILASILYFTIGWTEAIRWWGYHYAVYVVSINCACATCMVILISMFRTRVFLTSAFLIYIFWLWMTWAGFPVFYELP